MDLASWPLIGAIAPFAPTEVMGKAARRSGNREREIEKSCYPQNWVDVFAIKKYLRPLMLHSIKLCLPTDNIKKGGLYKTYP